MPEHSLECVVLATSPAKDKEEDAGIGFLEG